MSKGKYKLQSDNFDRLLDPELVSLPLPKIIKYNDEFSGKNRIIRTDDQKWDVVVDGRKVSIEWNKYSPPVRQILQRFLVWSFRKFDASTMISLISTVQGKKEDITNWVEKFSDSNNAKQSWELNGFGQLARPIPFVLRSYATFMCEVSLFGWGPEDLEYLRGWNWFSPQAVSMAEHGEGYYLSSSEENALISHLDLIAKKAEPSFSELRAALVIYLAYSYGLRRIQIASLRTSDVSILDVGGRGVAHLTFYQSKQRGTKKHPLLRKVKSEWSSILVNYYQSRDASFTVKSDLVHDDSFFVLPPMKFRRLFAIHTMKLLDEE